MKYLYLGSIICILTFHSTFAQNYSKAFVTDVDFFVRSGAFVNKKAFPFYFHYPEFVQDVHNDIRKYVKERFGSDTVIFLLPDSIYYYENWIAKKTKSKEMASSSQDKESIFLSVETLIQESTYINGVFTIAFTTRIKAYKSKGKKVFSFTNRIPFEIWESEEIYGDTLMKEEDFYAFYFDGLKLAFEGQENKIEKRYLQQAPTEHYSDFLLQAEKFYMKSTDFKFSYGPGMDELKPVLSFDNSPLKSYIVINDWTRVNSETFSSFKIHNKFKGVDYLLYFDERFDKDSNKLVIHLDFLDTAQKVVAEFTVDYQYILNGKISDREYTITWNSTYGVKEIKANNELIVLSKMMDDRNIIWVKNSITEEQLGDVFNLVFIYDFASNLIYD